MIFIVLTAITAVLVVLISKKVNTNYLLHGMDSQGNFCGYTPGYENYPIAFYSKIDVTDWFPYAVCIDACPNPDASYTTVNCVGTINTPSTNG